MAADDSHGTSATIASRACGPAGNHAGRDVLVTGAMVGSGIRILVAAKVAT
jgi:hypothetical protein